MEQLNFEQKLLTKHIWNTELSLTQFTFQPDSNDLSSDHKFFNKVFTLTLLNIKKVY